MHGIGDVSDMYLSERLNATFVWGSTINEEFSMGSTIAVTGATGRLGRIVIEKLRAKVPSDTIIGLARSSQHAHDLGVALREADYDHPKMLEIALAGVDVLLLISGNTPVKRVGQHRNVIAAAKQAGVRHIVYTSGLHADSVPGAIGGEHAATEQDLKVSGVAYTILRHGMYTENYMAQIPSAHATGALIGSAGEGRISSATRADYADAAIVTLTESGHEGQIYELAGDTAWTFQDLAAVLSEQIGQPISYRDLPPAQLVQILTDAGISPLAAEITVAGHRAASQGLLFDDSCQLSRLIGRSTTPLAVTVANSL